MPALHKSKKHQKKKFGITQSRFGKRMAHLEEWRTFPIRCHLCHKKTSLVEMREWARMAGFGVPEGEGFWEMLGLPQFGCEVSEHSGPMVIQEHMFPIRPAPAFWKKGLVEMRRRPRVACASLRQDKRPRMPFLLWTGGVLRQQSGGPVPASGGLMAFGEERGIDGLGYHIPLGEEGLVAMFPRPRMAIQSGRQGGWQRLPGMLRPGCRKGQQFRRQISGIGLRMASGKKRRAETIECDAHVQQEGVVDMPQWARIHGANMRAFQKGLRMPQMRQKDIEKGIGMA